MPISESRETCVLVLAPTGRDSALICESIAKQGWQSQPCGDVEELARWIRKGAGTALLAEEALIAVPIRALLTAIEEQPAWSDFHLLFLASGGVEASETSTRLLAMFGERANVTILERPVRVPTLISSVRSALRARRRQLEVRDYLADRERNEEKMLQTQKLESLGVLAGGVAHDFNNLLTGILGNASLALDSASHGMPVDGLLQDVIDAGQRAADLTRQLLAYAGKGRFVLRPIDLSSMVRQIAKLVHTFIPKHVELIFDLQPTLPLVEADSAQLQQIVMNLLINAAESIEPDRIGSVRIRTSSREIDQEFIRHSLGAEEISPGEYVCLEVSDTGSGMSETTMARIFDPFYTTKFMGRGLGLAAVLGIVRGHKGALKVHSVPGQGTTFEVLFPAIARAVQPVMRGPNIDRSGTGTVLVVDDEEMVRKLAKTALEACGYTVLLAENGQEGLAIFEGMAQRISLVLLDLAMPVMGGETGLQRIKALRPEVKVILSSGYDETDVRPRFAGKPLDGFLQKPYTAARLTEMVKSVLSDALVEYK